jgi:hypothetical protein
VAEGFEGAQGGQWSGFHEKEAWGGQMQRRQVAGWAQEEGVMAGWQPKVDSANGDFESLPEVAKSDMQVESRFRPSSMSKRV